MKKIILLVLFSLSGLFAEAQNTGFFNEYIPNLEQYGQQTMYINGGNIIIGGNDFYVTTQAATVMETDTNGNFTRMWSLTAADIEMYRCRSYDANDCIITGALGSSCGVSGNGFVGSFNYTTGTWNGGYQYNCNAQLGGFCTGSFTGTDAIKLSNGDIACVGPMDQTVSCCLGASTLGTYNCGVGTLTTGGVGYLDMYFGTGNYERGNDICLIRAGSTGDTATASGGDGFLKKYSLAYSGGAGCSYTSPAQPTAIGHTTGTFDYIYNPSWVADSTRQDYPESVVEDVNHNIFVCGYTYNYSSNNDYEGFILKVNSAGATQWCRTFYLNATASAYEEIINMAFVTEDGSNDIICTMQSYQSGNTELMRVSNATGAIVWANEYSMGTQTIPWGIHLTTNKTTVGGYNEYLVGTTGVNFPSAIGSYNMAMLVIDDKGNLLSSIGEGISPQDGDNYCPDVDQAGTGSYFISGNTPYTGGTTDGSLVAKINREYNTTGCSTYQFPVTVTVTNRAIGGPNQVCERAPVIYEVRGGCTMTPLAVTVAPVTAFAPAINCTCASLTVSATATTPSFCSGGSTSINASGATTYTWSPSTGLSATTGASVTASPTSTITYTVTGSSPSGCAPATATVVVTVSASPTVSITPSGGTTFCSGGSVNLTGNGATTYSWSPATGLSATSGTTVTANPSSTQTYTVIGTNGGGCTGSASIVVTVNATPTVTASATSTSICSGDNTTLNAIGANTYTWTPSTALSATTGSPVTATPSSSITYTVTGYSAAGCPSTPQVLAITVNPTPTITASATPTVICSGSSSNLAASGATTYSWSPSTSLSATTGADVVATPTNTITYDVTGTIGGCNSAPVAVTVSVNPTPSVTVSATSTTICSGNTTTLNTAGAAGSYTWSPAGSLSSSTGSSVTASPTSTTTYTMTPVTGSCTGTPQTIVITVNPTPTITASAGPATICSGNSTTLTASGGAGSYSWTPSTALSATTGSSVTANPTGSITYTVTATTGACSSAPQTVSVTVNPTPTVTASAAPTTICSGTSTTLTATGAAGNYTWTPNTALSASTGSSVTASPTSSITYTLTAATGGCTGTPQTVAITVNPTPTVSINITGISPSVCAGDTVGMIASGATTYTWSPATGLNTSTGTHVIASPGVTTTYTVTGTLPGGCTGTATQVITIYPIPTVTVSPTNSSVCSGTPTTLTAGGGTTYTWTPATGLSASTGSSVTANPSSTETYTVTGKNGNGCADSATAVVTVTTTPTVTVAPVAPTICPGGNVTLTASGGTTYSWNTGATTTSINVSPATTTTYTVTGMNGACSDAQTVVVTVASSLSITVTPPTPSVCKGDSVQLNASGAATFTWKPATALSCTNCPDPYASPTSAITYTIVGSSGACADSTTVSLSINPTPTITVTPPTPSVCAGGNVVLTAAGGTSYTWSPTASLSASTGTNVTASPTVSTTYTVVGTNASGCTDTTTIAVSITPPPTVSINITGISPAVCAGDTVGMIASGASTYTWSPATGLNATTGTHVIADPAVTTTYTLTGTTAGGCIGTATQVITIYPTPTVVVTATTPNLCSGNSTTITASGAANYNWSPSTGLSATTGNSVTANPSSTQTYTVAGQSASGCWDTSTVVITVSPTPTVSVAPNAPTICASGNVNLTASGGGTYTWLPATGLSATTGATVNATPTVTTTYTVTGTSGSCNDTATVVVTVATSLNVSVSPSAPILCSGGSVVLNANGAANFTWTPATALSCPTCSNPTANPDSTTTYKVVGSSGSCVDSASVTITVNPTPTISVSATTNSICTGGSSTLTAVGGSSYTWSPATGLSATTGAIVTASPLTSQTYTVTGANASGCSDTASVTIVVNPTPTVTISSSGSDTICGGGSVTLTANGTATSYTWSPAAGLNCVTCSTVVASPTVSTVYQVVASGGTCADSTTVSIVIGPQPTLTVTATSTSICAGNSTTLTAIGASTYAWTPSTGLSATTGSNVTATPGNTITYSVTGTTAGGCSDSGSIIITVNPTPTVTISSSGKDSICQGQNITLTANGGTGYVWSNGAITSTITVNPSSATTYSVVSSNGPCSDSAAQSVYVYPAIKVTMNSDSICNGNMATLNAVVTGGDPAYTYIWSTGSTNSSITVTPASTGYFTCVVQDACGDKVTDSSEVVTFSAPKAIFTATPDTIVGGEYVSFVNNSTNATSYAWNLGNGETSTQTNPYYQYVNAGEYVVTLVAANGGCKDSASDTVYVTETIFIPNVFTPNGDGQNDVFHVTMGGMKTYHIEIFNRWGEKLFESNSLFIDWDGTSMAGVKESDGTYFYIITASDYAGKPHNFNGYLQLIRN